MLYETVIIIDTIDYGTFQSDNFCRIQYFCIELITTIVTFSCHI